MRAFAVWHGSPGSLFWDVTNSAAQIVAIMPWQAEVYRQLTFRNTVKRGGALTDIQKTRGPVPGDRHEALYQDKLCRT